MVDFGSLAENAASKLGGSEEPKKEEKTASGDKWSDVGSSAKKAYTDYSKDDKVDYKEAGEVAQKAYSAYSSEGGAKDTASIGKSVVGGFMGKGDKEEKK